MYSLLVGRVANAERNFQITFKNRSRVRGLSRMTPYV